MSNLLCQQEDGVQFLRLVLIHEDRIKDPVHTRSVAEYAHRSCSPPYLSESSFNEIRRPYALPEVRVLKLEAGKEILDIGEQALHRSRVLLFPFLLPLPSPLPGLENVGCGVDFPEPFLDRLSIPNPHFVIQLASFWRLCNSGSGNRYPGQ